MIYSRINIPVSIILVAVFNAMSCTSLDPNPGQSNPGDGSECAKFTLHDAQVAQPNSVELYFQVNKCNDKPMDNIPHGDFIIEEDNTLISKYESVRRLRLYPQRFQRITVLILDMSGSVANAEDFDVFQEATKKFIENVARGQSVAIYTFDGRVNLQPLVDFTEVITDCNYQDRIDDLNEGVAALSDYEEIDVSTNLNGAIIEGIALLDRMFNEKAPGTIFSGSLAVFTDGTDQAARVSNGQAIIAASRSQHNIYTIGLGAEIDRDHLTSIGKNGRFFATDINGLQGEFEQAGDDIQASSDSFYLLEYCSPKRAGQHELKLTIKDTPGFTNYRFDASNFIGGCPIPDSEETNDVGIDGILCLDTDVIDDGNTDIIIGGEPCNSSSDCKNYDDCSIGQCENNQCRYIELCGG